MPRCDASVNGRPSSPVSSKSPPIGRIGSAAATGFDWQAASAAVAITTSHADRHVRLADAPRAAERVRHHHGHLDAGGFHPPPADGFHDTGDLGRLDASGRLHLVGRLADVIKSGGYKIYPEEIEAHYRQSPFIKEICVLGLAEPGRPTSERLYAVAVPDMDLLRERKIVNAGDMLRFEIEGLAVGLPAHKRVLGYEIWFEPLPRTTTQKIKRHEVERRVLRHGFNIQEENIMRSHGNVEM